MYAALPEEIQEAVRDACLLFDRDPAHRSLRLHELTPMKRGQHLSGTKSVSITMQYRALFVVVDGVNVWYWIGTHADCDRFTGKK